jgi:hypothetical protein
VSANIEHCLLSGVIATGDYNTLAKNQITSDFFTVPECQAVFGYLRDTYHNQNTPGCVPSADMVKYYFPSFVFSYAPDPVPILCAALRDSKMRMDLLSLAQKLQFTAEKDLNEAMSILKSSAQSLSSMEHVGSDLAMADALQLLMQRYHMVSNAQGITGIPYPWDYVNQETQGMQNGNYIILYARPKNMKTWIAIYMAVHAYLKSRRRVLFYTREMPNLEIAGRVATAMSGIDYKAYRNGQLDPNLLAYFQAVLQGLKQDEISAGKHGTQPCFVITADRSLKGGGVTWLQSKIREVKPDIVFVDGVYLMRDDRTNSHNTDWKNILHISQDLRQMALNLNIPIIAITKANKMSDKIRGDDDMDMGLTDGFNSDADAVWKLKHYVYHDEQTGLKKSEIAMYATDHRETDFGGLVINATPATNFEFIRPIVKGEDDDHDYGEETKKKQVKAPSAAFRRDPANYYQTTPSIPALR